MKLRRSAKVTSTSGNSSVPMLPTRSPAGSDALALECYPPSRKRNLTSKGPPLSVPSEMVEPTSADIPSKTEVASGNIKKRRLEEVFRRVCVICTNVGEDSGFSEADNVLKLKELEKLATLLGSWKLNMLDPRQWTLCGNCCSRLKELTSILDNIKMLETKVNQLADDLYTDVQKSFPADAQQDQDDSVSQVIYYRSQLFENRKTFVFEAKPQTDIFIEVTYLAGNENVGQPENNIEGIPSPLHGIETVWTEELENPDPHEFDIKHLSEASDADLVDDALTEVDEYLDLSPSEDPVARYVCDYIRPDCDSPCLMSFNNNEAFKMHKKAHTLEIPLGNAKKMAEQHGLKMYNKMLQQQETFSTSESLQCPVCGKSPFDLANLKRHVTRVHNFKTYPCPRAYNKERKCSEFFSSEEELQDHLQTCSMKSNPRAKLKKEQGAEVVHPRRVENDELDCVICSTNHSRSAVGYIGHMLKIHDRCVCIQKDRQGLTCLKAFKTLNGIQMHLTEEHDLGPSEPGDSEMLYLEPRYQDSQCPICGTKVLATQQDYVNHVREHEMLVCGKFKNSNSEVEVCTRIFDRQKDLELHLRVCGLDKRKTKGGITINRVNWCRFCRTNATYSSRSEWLDHVRKHEAFTCNIYQPTKKRYCNQIFMLKPLLKLHIETEHPNVGPEEVPGPIDNGGWTGIDVLNDESFSAIRGLPVEGRYECKICPATFDVYDEAWVDHVRSHGATICDVMDKSTGKPCLALFFSMEKLQLHCKKKHEKLLEGGYHCAVCERGCKSLEVWKRHQRFHGAKRGLLCDKCGKEGTTTKRAYKCSCSNESMSCETCGKQFKRSVLLRAHVAIHHQGFRHVCKVCGVEYKSVTALNHHSFRKHGEGESVSTVHECQVCQQKFVSKGLRDNHFRIKHGERRYKCDRDNCDWAFKTSGCLKRHISQIHENLRPFICDVCGSTFKSKGHWAMHMKKHEAGESVKPVREIERKPKPWKGESIVEVTESLDQAEHINFVEYNLTF